MKNIILNYRLYLILPLIAGFCGCGSDEETEAQRVQKILTSGSWTMESTSVGAVDKTDLYEGLQITFSERTYASTNGSPVWPASDTWQFSDDSGKSFQRGDGIVVTIETISENSLVLIMTWDDTTLGSGRINSIAGAHTFSFTK